MKTLRRFSQNHFFSHARITAAVILILAAAAMAFVAASPPGSPLATTLTVTPSPQFSTAVAFDISPAVRDLPPAARPFALSPATVLEVRPERGPAVQSKGYSGDAALQPLSPALAIPAPLLTFEGLAEEPNMELYIRFAGHNGDFTWEEVQEACEAADVAFLEEENESTALTA